MTELVNTATGEIVQVSVEEQTAVARLTTAIAALSDAVDFMPIADVVSIKAQVATIQTATKELGMSQEAQELAAEAVRRSEWTLGMAIRRGQADGSVATQGHALRPTVQHEDYVVPALPTDYATKGELYGARGEGILTIADAAPSVEEFDAALGAAKAEGNLSRANVARKAREASGNFKARPRPAAEINLNAIASYADRAAREAQKLTADQIRRVKPNAAEWVGGIRNSVEILTDLLRSLEEN